MNTQHLSHSWACRYNCLLWVFSIVLQMLGLFVHLQVVLTVAYTAEMWRFYWWIPGAFKWQFQLWLQCCHRSIWGFDGCWYHRSNEGLYSISANRDCANLSRTINTSLRSFTLLILFMFHGGYDCEVVKHLTCISWLCRWWGAVWSMLAQWRRPSSHLMWW